jgi:hypothetical protein
MVSDDINDFGCTFEVMPPNLEGLEDREELFIMGVIVELGRGQSAGVECNGVDVTGGTDREDACNGIIRCISLNYERAIGLPVHKHRSDGECFFQRVESILAGSCPIPSIGLAGESG